MKGYYNLPEETAACIDANGWLHSGDIGIMDAEGYYKVTGRLKDMITRPPLGNGRMLPYDSVIF